MMPQHVRQIDDSAPRRGHSIPRLEWFDQVRPREHEWLVDGILPLDGLAVLYGESSAGKSCVALDWGLRIASGMAVMDRPTRRAGIAYVAAEGASGVRKRVAAWRQQHGVAGSQPFAIIGGGVDLRTATSTDLDALIGVLKQSLATFEAAGAPLGVVIVDTLASATPGAVETTAEGMGAALHALRRLSEEAGSLVLFVHHTGHTETHRPRGWSGLIAAVDTSIEVARRRDTRTIKLRKQRDAEDDVLLGAFRLGEVSLDDTQSSSVVVDYVETSAIQRDAPSAQLKPSEQRMLDAIQHSLEKYAIPPPAAVLAASPGIQRCATRSVIARSFLAAASADPNGPHDGPPTDAQRQEIQRALAGLVRRNLIGQHKVSNKEAYIWLTTGL